MIAMQSPRPSLLDLHPVEALLALLLISAAALHRLVIDPPLPLRRPVPDLSGTIKSELSELIDVYMPPMLKAALRQRQARVALAGSAAPTVAELRTMARQRGILSAGGRPIHKARRADLLSALGL